MINGLLKKDIDTFLPYFEHFVWNNPNLENIYSLGIIHSKMKNYTKTLMLFRLISRQNPNYRELKKLIDGLERKLGIKTSQNNLVSNSVQFINKICLKLNLTYKISIDSNISEINKVRRIISKKIHPDTKPDVSKEIKKKF